MLKDLLSQSAKQFEQEDGDNVGFISLSKEEYLARISSAFALGEQSGIQKCGDEIEKELFEELGLDDPECEHGYMWQDCTNKKCDKRSMALLYKHLCKLLSALQSNLTTKKD